MVDETTASKRLTVLGAGTWGITLADILAKNAHQVHCWDIAPALINSLSQTRTHPKLPEFEADPAIVFTTDLDEALKDCEGCVFVVPSRAMRSACESVHKSGRANRIGQFVICSKGIEQQTLMLMNEVLSDVLGVDAGRRTAVLSGPSHAEEVSQKLPTTVVAAAEDPELAERIQHWFIRPYLRVYRHDDIQGVELGASIKNVIAIAAGVSDGLGFGDNARAALMTRGLAEIVRLGLARGSRLETFMGLSGIGDLIVTAGSRHSRNHLFGELLAEGVAPKDALERVGMVVEGYPTARSTRELALREGIEMPITEAVYQVCYEGTPPRQAVVELLSREPKPEHY